MKWDDSLEDLLKTFRKRTRLLRKNALQRWEPDHTGSNGGPRPYLIAVYGASTSKLSVACGHIQRSISQHDHLAYAAFARLLLEQTAMLLHIAGKATHLFPEDGSEAPDAAYEALFGAFRTAVGGSRVDWRALFKLGFRGLVDEVDKYPPEIPQTNALTWIKSWSKRDASIGVLYALLCDAVHPSKGSDMFFMHFDSPDSYFTASKPSVLGDLIVWNTLEPVVYVQKIAVGILGAFRMSITHGDKRN